MNAFTCKVCGKTSYSTADIESHTNPNCPYCGANMREAIVISAATKIIMACENMKISDPVKVVIRELFQADEDMCVICGSYVPEGRMVCRHVKQIRFMAQRKEE
jgi:NAD-dependent SIR2 family protein deacetylase